VDEVFAEGSIGGMRMHIEGGENIGGAGFDAVGKAAKAASDDTARVLADKFRDFEVEQRLEIAEAGSTAAAKLQALMNEVATAKSLFGVRSNEYKEALTRELTEATRIAAAKIADDKRVNDEFIKLATEAGKAWEKQQEDNTKAAAKAAEDINKTWTSVLEPIDAGFNAMFDSVIRGTQKLSEVFRRMAADILLSIAKSGIHDLLLGGKEGSFGAGLFGQENKGGGLAGALAAQFGGPAVTGALTKALTTAFAAAQSFIAVIFKGALSGIGSTAGAAVGAVASGAGQAQAFKDALSPIQLLMQGHLAEAITQTGIMTAHLAHSAAHLAVSTLHYGQALIHNIWLALIAAFEALKAAFSPGGLFAAQGGIVPSAAGGMILGGGAQLVIAHPREMILPADISEGIQSWIGTGRAGRGSSSSDSAQQGGGPTIIVNYAVNSPDPKTFHDLVRQHGGIIADTVYDRMTRYGGRFKKRVG
jgi:hypothetical protein